MSGWPDPTQPWLPCFKPQKAPTRDLIGGWTEVECVESDRIRETNGGILRGSTTEDRMFREWCDAAGQVILRDYSEADTCRHMVPKSDPAHRDERDIDQSVLDDIWVNPDEPTEGDCGCSKQMAIIFLCERHEAMQAAIEDAS